MRNQQPEQVEIRCIVKMETPKAILIHADKRDIWIPISQVHYIKKDGDNSIVRITPWIAQKNSLA